MWQIFVVLTGMEKGPDKEYLVVTTIDVANVLNVLYKFPKEHVFSRFFFNIILANIY